jgi:hypothetical protein
VGEKGQSRMDGGGGVWYSIDVAREAGRGVVIYEEVPMSHTRMCV